MIFLLKRIEHIADYLEAVYQMAREKYEERVKAFYNDFSDGRELDEDFDIFEDGDK